MKKDEETSKSSQEGSNKAEEPKAKAPSGSEGSGDSSAQKGDGTGGTSAGSGRHGPSAGQHGASNSNSVTSSNGDPDYQPASDPATALKAAERALASAEKSAQAHDYGTAYRQALTGWEQANTFTDKDAGCRAIATKLLSYLDKYGELANRDAGVIDKPPPRYKTLILK